MHRALLRPSCESTHSDHALTVSTFLIRFFAEQLVLQVLLKCLLKPSCLLGIIVRSATYTSTTASSTATTATITSTSSTSSALAAIGLVCPWPPLLSSNLLLLLLLLRLLTTLLRLRRRLSAISNRSVFLFPQLPLLPPALPLL
jgi:hypothetical protein